MQTWPLHFYIWALKQTACTLGSASFAWCPGSATSVVQQTSFFPFLHWLRTISHGLLGTGVRALLGGWTPVEAPSAPSRSNFHGQQAPDALRVAGIPKPLLNYTLLIAGKIQPHEGLTG